MYTRRFLRMMGVRSGLNYSDDDVHENFNQYSITSLPSRIIALDLIFLFKVVNGLLDCSELFQLIGIHIPQRTRLIQTFTRHHHHAANAYHSTFSRLMRLGNASELEFFGLSYQTFRAQAFSFAFVSDQFTF
ncbi:hypothetical protein J6590_042998 [Homalodisca vitripennis]|nr:hypothetical protein J6590_042998 [Homalodisca vitripennis]